MDENSNSGFLLDSYRVLDLTDEKGLLCGRILADLGADVIKVERPGGDIARNREPFYHDLPYPEKSLFWFAFNANKRDITLNIETQDGQELFKTLVKNADFVIESFSPGYMDKLGLGYSALMEINPRIIMISISPFGQTGPYKDYKATDIGCLAMGGWTYICGDEDRPPLRISAEQAYLQASAQASVGGLIALYHRGLTGEGQHVDVSIQDSVLWTAEYSAFYWYASKTLFSRSGSSQKRMNVTYQRIFPCKDGYISTQVLVGRMGGPVQARLVEAMESEGMAEDLEQVDWSSISFEKSPQKDIEHWEDVMCKYFMSHTKAELNDIAREYNLFLCPVNSLKEVCNYEQLEARGYWARVEHPELRDTIIYPGFLFRLSEDLLRKQQRAPLIGEHNQEIYEKELGFSKQKLVILKQANAI